MAGVLVIAEHVRGRLRDVTRELITAGLELCMREPGPLMVAVIGAETASLVDECNVEGVDEVLTVTVPQAEFVADVYVQAAAAIVRDRDPSVTLAGFTVDGMGFGPALAVRLGMGFASDVIAVGHVDGELIAVSRDVRRQSAGRARLPRQAKHAAAAASDGMGRRRSSRVGAGRRGGRRGRPVAGAFVPHRVPRAAGG